MSAIDRVLLWAKSKGVVFATQSGGHPDDFLDELLPFLDKCTDERAILLYKQSIFTTYVEKAHAKIPSNCDADIILNKMFSEIARIDASNETQG